MSNRHVLIPILCLSLVLLVISKIPAQEKAILTCTVSTGSIERINSPVSLNIEQLHLPQDQTKLTFWEIESNSKKKVPFQMHQGMLHWILEGKNPQNTSKIYQLIYGPANDGHDHVEVLDKTGTINISVNNKPILSYQYAETNPPAGYSTLFRRGGYIHPLQAPSGEVLTRIQPPDHIHHYGIWNPWTKTHFEGREIDFWNLYKGQGTVRADNSPKRISGPVFGEITAFHDHIDLNAPDPSGLKTALYEQWRIRAWNADPEQKIWIIDFQSTMNCATDSLFTIDAYRYQGFGYRATGKWDDNTAVLLTSEGKNKSNGNATRARWCDINGISDVGTSGILFMTHPGNYNFPEELRIWPTGSNQGKENVFFNFNPAQHESWVLEPGRSYTLKYRMLVYDGKISPEQADNYWQDFTNPLQATLNVVRNPDPDRVLVYTKNGEGYIHDNLEASVAAIQKLGNEHGFDVDASDDPAYITDENLSKYKAIILSNTNNETFDTHEQKLAFQRYIQAGGGLVGIHSVTGSEREWPWFWKVLGGKFLRHPPLQKFRIKLIDQSHASIMHLNGVWNWEDECYYMHHLNPGIQVIMAADLTTVKDDKKGEYPGSTFGNYIPLSWYQELYGGRQWYTALGHKIEYYSNPEFTQHILGGILWAMEGRKLNYQNATTTLIMN